LQKNVTASKTRQRQSVKLDYTFFLMTKYITLKTIKLIEWLPTNFASDFPDYFQQVSKLVINKESSIKIDNRIEMIIHVLYKNNF